MIRLHKKILFVFFLFPLCLFSQQEELKFEKISVRDGLSHNNVYSIIQDKEGFIWIGTQDGLNLYDGYKFTIFRHQPSNPNSLSSNNFGKMYQDSSGIIWLGTYGGGLDKLDPLTLTFTHNKYNAKDPNSISSDRIQFVHEDKYGLLWIGTTGDGGGLNMFNRTTNKFVRFLYDEKDSTSLNHYRAKAIAEDKQGNLWIGTAKGLNLFDRKTGTFKRFYHKPSNPNSLSHNHIQSIIVDHVGIIWLGGRGGGLNRFDPQTGKFTHYNHNIDDPGSISDDMVEVIFEDSDSNLWVGTYSGGLNLFDRKNNRFYNYVYDPNNPNSIVHNRIEYIFEDKSKILWIGTRGGGISRLDLKKKQFFNYIYSNKKDKVLPHPSIYTINGDSVGNLWFGSDGNGIVKYNRITNKKIFINDNSIKNNKLSKNRVWSICIDSRGITWAGTYDGGLNRIIPGENGAFSINTFQYSSLNKYSLAGRQVNIVYEDKKGRIWVGTKRGLNLLISSPYAKYLSFKHFKNDVNNPSSISDNYISSICEDSYGSLWVGTYVSGLNQIDLETNNIKRYYHNPNESSTISNNRIQTIFEDSFGNLWIGTEGAGLNKFDRKSQSFVRIYQDNEFYSNVIMAMIEDESGNLWISTSGGIVKFNIAKEQFEKKYDITDGLISHGFNRNAVFKSKANTIYFGSTSGVTYFNPEDVKDNQFVPAILLTDFKILDVSLKKIDSIRYKKFRKEKIVELNYDENVFHIEFAAADYSAVSKNAFKYKLEGFENDWQTSFNQRMITYTNLYPGHYTFRVIGSNNDGVWNTKGNSLEIVIHPPFYLTKGFISVSVISVILLIYLIIRLRINRLDRDKRILEVKVKKRTQEINKQKEVLKHANEEIRENARLKEMFLANTSHEIRTPLNVIVGFTNLLMNSELNQKQQAYISNIKNSSNSLLVLINDILDFSKIEADKLILEEIRFDIRKTIKTILNPLKVKATEKNLKVEYHIDGSVPENVIGDPVRLNQILVNLIGNSIKFTKDEGLIKLSVNLLQKNGNKVDLIFRVADNGIGISAEKLDDIFDSFSQASSDTSRKYGGTGLGLTIVRRLVEMQNGSVQVKSKLGNGSVFTFSLTYKMGKKGKIEEAQSEIQSKDSNLINKLEILIVEDNKANQTLAVDTIHMFNSKIAIDVADNGLIALDKINLKSYDLIIMDIQMPEMNGYDTTSYIRNKLNSSKSKIPILGMSAHAMDKEKERCLDLGMNDYITKPFNPNVLFSKILKLTGMQEKAVAEEKFIPETLLVKNKYEFINLEFLTRTYKGNFDKVKSILIIYLNNIPKQIDEFINEIEAKNCKKLKGIAHSLKTSFKYLGVDHMHKLFKLVELESSTDKLSDELIENTKTVKNDWLISKKEIEDFLIDDIMNN